MEGRIGFGKRLGAYLIDFVIVMILGTLLGGMVGGLLGGAATGGDMGGGIMAMAMGAMAGLGLFGTAYGLIEAFTGASPGKMILGIKIGTAGGTKADIGLLIGRYAVKNISMILMLLTTLLGIEILGTLGNILGLIIFIGCFFVLANAKQAFHDMILKTAVYPKAKVS